MGPVDLIFTQMLLLSFTPPPRRRPLPVSGFESML